MARPVHPPCFMVLALYTVVRRARARSKDNARFKIYDVLFDDQNFAVKYLVVNVARFALAKRVLVPVSALLNFDAAREEIALDLTRHEVEHEPLERDLLEALKVQVPVAPGVFPLPLATTTAEPADPHLWSARDLLGYSLRAGELITGHVEDIILEPTTWRIRSLVVAIRQERQRRILIDPASVQRIHWLGATVHVTMTPEEITSAPDLILGPVEVAA